MRFLMSMAVLALTAVAMPWTATRAVAQNVVTQTVTCTSTGAQRTDCPVEGRIRSVRQLSAFAGRPCIEGFSWGYERRNLWVERGCSGIFEVEVSQRNRRARNSDGQGGDRQAARGETVTETVDCRARGRGRQECPVKGRIQSVEPVGTFTGVPCQRGSSWGYENRYVWVERGCEARFEVTFTSRNARPEPEPEPEVAQPANRDAAPSASGLASSPLASIVAQGACTGLYPSLGADGYVFAVPRQCSKDAPGCDAICRDLKGSAKNSPLQTILQERTPACFNSIHVYDKGASGIPGVAGTQTYVYNACEAGCGPNYCCCSAE